MDLVPLKDCIRGRAYRLRCRNLAVGVFNGDDGFIGIRTKFGHRYLFTEYHWEQGEPFGTVSGAVDLGVDVPEGVQLCETLGSIDQNTDRPLVHDKEASNPHFPDRKGWWRYTDTDEVAGPKVRAISVGNDELFAFLEQVASNTSEPTS